MSGQGTPTCITSNGRSRVSAIITTYNYAEFIEEAIASVTHQTEPVDEIIVVDDGSTDGTRAIVERLDISNLRYIWQENQGAGGARNRGLKEASCELIAYLDADDRWLPGKVEAQHQLLDSHPHLAMVTGGKWRLNAETGEQKLELFKPRTRPEFLRDLFIHNQAGNPSMAMMRRAVACRLGGFNTRLRWGQDWDFFIRLAQTYSFGVLNEPVIVYRWHRSNLTHQRRGERADVLYAISRESITRYENSFRSHWLLARARSQRDVEKAEDALSNGRRRDALRLSLQALAMYPFERTRTKVTLVAKSLLGLDTYRKIRRTGYRRSPSVLTEPKAQSTSTRSRSPARLAYFMSRFPKLSETFILREMLELESAGTEIAVFALVEESGNVVHDELDALRAERHYPDYGSARLWRDQIYWFTRRPRRYLCMWWRAIAGNWRSPAFALRAVLVALAAASFAREMERRGITHIHAHYATHPALTAYLVHILSGASYSITTHAHDIYVDRTMLAEKLEHATLVVTISDFNRRLLSEFYPDVAPRLRVIHCGVETTAFEPNGASSKTGAAIDRYPLEIVCVGSLEPYKGQRYLVEACAMLRDRGIPFRCMIAGGGPDAAGLRELIDRLDLADRVRLIGPITQTQVRALLDWSTVFVLPSVIAPSGKMEGIPVALMEAMAAGRVVVSTNISGIPELVIPGTTGFLVEPERPHELAATLAGIRNNPRQAQQIGAQGREHVHANFDLRVNSVQLREELMRAIPVPRERPFKIAQIVDNLEIGGAQQLLKTFAIGIGDPNVDLTVVSLSNNITQPVQVALEEMGIRVVNLGGATLKSVRRFVRLFKFLRREQIDLTQTHLRYANILGILASRLAGIPAIGTLHSAGADRAHYHPLRQVFETACLRFLANRVVAVGPAVRNAHQDRLAGKTMDVFPNAVLAGEGVCAEQRASIRRDLVGDPGRTICISVGRLVPVKGFLDMIEAFSTVVRRHPDAALVIAGSGVQRRALEDRIEELELQDSVYLLGARQDINELLAATDIFVNASHLEGLPVSLLEAMAAGLPSIATTVGDVPTVLNERNGILVPPHRPGELADAINSLIDDPCRREALGLAAREYIAEHHEAGRWAQRLTDFGREIASQSNPNGVRRR